MGGFTKPHPTGADHLLCRRNIEEVPPGQCLSCNACWRPVPPGRIGKSTHTTCSAGDRRLGGIQPKPLGIVGVGVPGPVGIPHFEQLAGSVPDHVGDVAAHAKQVAGGVIDIIDDLHLRRHGRINDGSNPPQSVIGLADGQAIADHAPGDRGLLTQLVPDVGFAAVGVGRGGETPDARAGHGTICLGEPQIFNFQRAKCKGRHCEYRTRTRGAPGYLPKKRLRSKSQIAGGANSGSHGRSHIGVSARLRVWLRGLRVLIW